MSDIDPHVVRCTNIFHRMKRYLLIVFEYNSIKREKIRKWFFHFRFVVDRMRSKVKATKMGKKKKVKRRNARPIFTIFMEISRKYMRDFVNVYSKESGWSVGRRFQEISLPWEVAASSINPRHERGKCGGRWNSVRTACEHRIVYLAAFLRMSRLV